MTNLLQNMSYDHIVLIMCFAAVIVSGSIMHVSAYFGNANRNRRLGGDERERRLTLERTAHPEPAAQQDKAA